MNHYTILASLLAILATTPASAGPLEGEIFEYRLGDRYPVSKHTQGHRGFVGGYELLAEKPTMPAGFKEVRMMVTSKTYTIANIYGTAEFRSLSLAKAFATKYSDLLNTLYRKSCAPVEAFYGETVKMLCSGKYELSVRPDTDGKRKKIYEVTVGLQMGTGEPALDAIRDLFRAEDEELRTEWAQRRVDAAAKSQQLNGLQ